MRRESRGILAGLLAVGCSGALRETPEGDSLAPVAAEATARQEAPKRVRYTPDWSFAGYRGGAALPNRAPATHQISDFGAVAGDGKDDTRAIVEALRTLQSVEGPVVLEFEEGIYDLSDILFLERSELVLRGAGSERTTLRFSRPLLEMKTPERIAALKRYLHANDKKVDGHWFSEFSWTGGVIWSRLPTGDQIAFDGPGPLLGPSASVVTGRRGEREVLVEGEHDYIKGETVVMRWFNTEGEDSELVRHVLGLEGRSFGARLTEDPDRVLVEQALTISEAAGARLRVEPALLHDARVGWKTQIARVERLDEVGLEGFSIQFPDVDYGGHHLEAGFNGLHLNDLRDSWVRDVRIGNADSGVLTDRSDRLTLKKIRVVGRPGHYGIHLGSVNAVLVEDFDIAPEFAHSISFNSRCSGSVFFEGTVRDGALDQHRGFNHQNLFDSIVAIESDETSRLFDHGGARYWGPPHGAFNTFFGIDVRFAEPSSDSAQVGSVKGAGPAWLINVRGNRPLELDYEGAHVGSDEARTSLLQAQRQHRATRRDN